MIYYQQPSKQQLQLDWIRLFRCKNVGPRTFWDLIKIYGDPSTALEAIPKLSQTFSKNIEIPTIASIKQEVSEVERFGAQLITAYDSIYPTILKHLSDAPPVLTIKGKTELLSKNKNIAIVGSRNASSNGCTFAKQIAYELGRKGYTIISGLARGIDYSAHYGALETGTIGVIAGGIDNIYPQEHNKLYHALYNNGLIISEFPFGASPTARHFPQRNRIISGLSYAVIVVEATMKSGTLITARFATEQGRDVFAVPGSPLDPRAAGTNNLIKQGANIFTSCEDVVEALDSLNHTMQNTLFEHNNTGFLSPTLQYSKINEIELQKWRMMLVSKLSYTPCDIDELIEQINIPTPIFNRLVVEMELAGKAERIYGNKIVLLY